MTIPHGYTTLEAMKRYFRAASTDADDDTVIEGLVEAVSRYLDDLTLRTFYARAETRLFDLPPGRELRLDDDLLTVTTLTNGDGVEIPVGQYLLLPANVFPKYAIKLKASSTYSWQLSASADWEQVISVAGTWGYVADTPKDIEEACQQIVLNAYKRRFGDHVEAVATVTAAGVVITPKDIGPFSASVIARYKKRL